MPFEFQRLSIPEVILVKPKVFKDERGFFAETYKHSEFEAAGIKEFFVQDNHSKSSKGVLRGLHYQVEPFAQAKLVGCIRGCIYDVAVDVRNGSKTFGKWVGTVLSEENMALLYIPSGFAHGFVVTSETAEIVYKCSKEYSPAHEHGVIWNDKNIGIKWPVADPILSKKDAAYLNLDF